MTSVDGDLVMSDEESMPISAKAKAAAKKLPAKPKAGAGATAAPKTKATKAAGGVAKKKAEPLARRKSNETAKESDDMEVDDVVVDQSASSSVARDTPVPTAGTKKSATQTYQKVSFPS
jgi:hypothetical protein